MKVILAVMLLIMGSVALGVAQDEQPLVVVPATLNLINEQTTQTSLGVRLTAGTYAINGGTVRVADQVGRKRYITFSDSILPGESLEFTVDGLLCDQGYRIREQSSDGYASTAVSALTLPCE